MRSFTRVAINLTLLAIATMALLVYAALQWVGGAVIEDRYRLTVPLAHTGGLFLNQEVTVLGHGVGQIAEIRLTDAGVDVELDIRGGEAVPANAVAQILRRSPIGEQAINLIPVTPTWEPPDGPLIPARIQTAERWEAAERGARVEPKATSFPTEVPQLLRTASRLLNRIDRDDLGVLVHELATAVGGRSQLLKELNRATLDLNTTLVSGIPDFERLIESSGPLLDELNEHRQALAGIFPDFADLSETLAANRPELETIIDRGTVALREGEAFIRSTRADQACLMEDFTALNGRLARPDNLHNMSRLLELATNFYLGFDVITQYDPYRPNVEWQRINLLMFEPFGGQDYIPDRPTPQTKPGAACVSPWGVGVDAVRQPDHQPPDPTAPPIDFAPLVEGGGESPAAAPAGSGSGAGGAVRPLPATGGGVSLAAPLALLGAWLGHRARSRRRW